MRSNRQRCTPLLHDRLAGRGGKFCRQKYSRQCESSGGAPLPETPQGQPGTSSVQTRLHAVWGACASINFVFDDLPSMPHGHSPAPSPGMHCHLPCWSPPDLHDTSLLCFLLFCGTHGGINLSLESGGRRGASVIKATLLWQWGVTNSSGATGASPSPDLMIPNT